MPFPTPLVRNSPSLTLTGFLRGSGYRVLFLSDGTAIRGTLISGDSGILTSPAGLTGVLRGREYIATLSTAGFPDPGIVNYSTSHYWGISTVDDPVFDPLNNPVTAILVGLTNNYLTPGVPYADYGGDPYGHAVHWGNAADLTGVAVNVPKPLNSGVTFGARIQNVSNNHGLAVKHTGTNGAVSSGSGSSAYSAVWDAQGANANQNSQYYATAYRLTPGVSGARNCRQCVELNSGALVLGDNSVGTLTAPVGAFVAPSAAAMIMIGPCFQGNVFPSLHRRHRTVVAGLLGGYMSDADFLSLVTLIKAGVPG